MATRIGIVGAGFIGGRHARSLTAQDGVEVATADPQAERAARLAEELGARAYATGEQLLDAEELDARYVCVSPHGHGALEEAAIERGLPLSVEKPLAADRDTAERRADLVEAAGVLTSLGYHWRYLDTVELARELLVDRPARMVRAAWRDKAPRVDWWSRQVDPIEAEDRAFVAAAAGDGVVEVPAGALR